MRLCFDPPQKNGGCRLPSAPSWVIPQKHTKWGKVIGLLVLWPLCDDKPGIDYPPAGIHTENISSGIERFRIELIVLLPG